ncbi:MAG: MlaD family protein [Thermodesulfovibrionales bacterium]|jgi:phospholipid/cholesterol/gamma-HCH transport system substrate-binding protein|nr:MlaD family protein [Thermodesulfovibrionales bacterium]
MELMKETDERFIGIEKKIGLFVFIAIAGIVTAMAIIGIQHGVFTPRTKIYFIADSGQGINEGTAVKLSGFKIGKVARLSLDDVARVKVELSINTKYMKWIRTDSKARLFKEGFIGDSVIEITPGSEKAKQVTENGIIEFERAKGLGEIAEELKEEIKPVLSDVKEIIHYINNPQGDIKQTLKNLRKISEDLPETQQNLNALLKDANKGVNATTKKIDSVLDSTKQTMITVDDLIKKVDKDIPNILEKTNKSLENIQKTTEEIKKATEQTAPKIPSMLKKGEDAAEGAKEITDSAKKIWPIRLFIKEPEEKTLDVDSYE